jgi:D-3-phosphoglycerate dehydrogenase
VIRAYDPFVEESEFIKNSASCDKTLEELLKQSDVVSLHCPLTKDTKHLLNEKTINIMRPGSIVINTARGGLIDEAALIKAFESNHIAAAGLDTFETEPPPKDHPFFTMENVVVSPHIGGVTEQAAARVGVEAVNNIVRFLEGSDLNSLSVANRGLLKLEN